MNIDQKPLRIAVTGVTGRMGKEIIRSIIKYQYKIQEINNTIVLGAAIVRPLSTVCGMDIGKFVESKKQGVTITDDIESVKDNFDILIDFSHPTLTIEYLKFCMMNHKNMVIGTTGLSKDNLNLITTAAQKIGIVFSANFSIGITIMLKLLQKVSKLIGANADIDIVEIHHKKKNDIPSGTAIMMKDLIISSIIDHDTVAKMMYKNYDYHNKSLVSNNNNVHVHSLRSGDIIGEHTVIFSSIGERLEIVHKASSRTIFANGALVSARWLGSSKIGLFDLNNVLILK